jgi:hypothetical protein
MLDYASLKREAKYLTAYLQKNAKRYLSSFSTLDDWYVRAG